MSYATKFVNALAYKHKAIRIHYHYGKLDAPRNRRNDRIHDHRFTLFKEKYEIRSCTLSIRCYPRQNWETKYKDQIDCACKHASFSRERIKYLILANESIQPVSASAIMNNYNNGCQMFSVIPDKEPISNDSDVKKLRRYCVYN